MVDRVDRYHTAKALKPEVSGLVMAKNDMLRQAVKGFYETFCERTETKSRIETSLLYHFFVKVFPKVFHEQLTIDGKFLFNEHDFEESTKITQTLFNKEITHLHGDFGRQDNVMVLNGLILKVEKPYWGDQLEFLRNSDVIKQMEATLKEKNHALGMVETFNEPFKQGEQLQNEIFDFPPFLETASKEFYTNFEKSFQTVWEQTPEQVKIACFSSLFQAQESPQETKTTQKRRAKS
jgi:hypothetical protein